MGFVRSFGFNRAIAKPIGKPSHQCNCFRRLHNPFQSRHREADRQAVNPTLLVAEAVRIVSIAPSRSRSASHHRFRMSKRFSRDSRFNRAIAKPIGKPGRKPKLFTGDVCFNSAIAKPIGKPPVLSWSSRCGFTSVSIAPSRSRSASQATEPE